MWPLGQGAIIIVMTHPQKFLRLMLVADPRPPLPEAASRPVRRYRLARPSLDPRAASPARRYPQLRARV
jgi:hypothetical protein